MTTGTENQDGLHARKRAREAYSDDRPVLTFSDSQGSEVTIDPDHSLFPESPHQIQDTFVTEGLYFYGTKRQKYWVKNGRKNYSGVGTECEEIIKGRQPFIVVAQQTASEPWLEVRPELKPLEPMIIGGKTRDWAPFAPFPGMMDFDTASKIINREHLHRGSPREIIEDMVKEINRLLEVESEVASTIAALTLGTWVHQAFAAYPYGWFYGMPGTGKTTALGVIHSMAYHAIFTSGMSNSALFRLVDQNHCTLCYDEAETLNPHISTDTEHQERVSLFNDGYRAGVKVYRTEKDPQTQTFAQIGYDPYSPKFLASVNAVNQTLQQRCLAFVMLKALSEEKSKAIVNQELSQSIRQRLYAFLFAEGVRIKSDAMDERLNADLMGSYRLRNREWELFKPPLLLAQCYFTDLLEDITKVLASQRAYQAEEASQSNEAIALESLMEVAASGTEDARAFVSYVDWRAAIINEYPDLKYITPRTLSTMLKKVGLGAIRGRGTGNQKGVDVARHLNLIESVMKRMGIVGSQRNQNAQLGGLE